MKTSTKRTIAIAALLAAGISVSAAGCDGQTQAETASKNSSVAADNFEVQRKITAMNLRSGEFIFFAEGRCSLDLGRDDVVLVQCKRGPNEYTKDYYARGPEIFWSAVQQGPIDVSVYKNRVIIKPEGLVPEVEMSVGVQ